MSIHPNNRPNTLGKTNVIKNQTNKLVGNEIKMFHQNIENLINRIEPLQIILKETDPTIIVLTEHNVKEKEIGNLKINNYTINSHYCRKISRKGGVMICAKDHVNGRQLDTPELSKLCEDKTFEFCVVKYNFGLFKFILIGIYRSPSSNVFDFLGKLNVLIEKISNRCNNII